MRLEFYGRGGCPGSLATLAVLTALIVAGPAGAATLRVTDCLDDPGGGSGQLRRLVLDAAPGDLILVPACTIRLSAGEIVLGADVSVSGVGAALSVLEGGGTERIFHVLPGVIVSLAGLTLRNGHAQGAGTASDGGGIRNQGDLRLTGVVVSDNVADRYGGGIANLSRLTLRHVTLSGNAAVVDSGAVDNPAGDLVLANVTISGNHAGRDAGGILTFTGLTASNVTITGNQADADGVGGGTGGGIYRIGGVLAFRNSIVAGNAAGGAPSDCHGSLTVDGPLLVGTLDDCALLGTVTAATVGADPALGPLSAGGDGLPVHALLPGSPALDAGDGACEPVDQQGHRRPRGQRCDLGAYERPVARDGREP